MNTAEAMKALLEGKKITSKDWLRNKLYVSLVHGNLVNQDGDVCGMPSGNKIIYEEPKPKIKIYQWAIKSPYNPKWFIAAYMYPDEVSVREEWTSSRYEVIRLDHTILEVEDYRCE